MSDHLRHTNQVVDHLFRHEASKLVATLTRIFGTINIQMAEDIVQETLITALHHWGSGSIPDNPAAWITQVAKRKALNELKRVKVSNNFSHTTQNLPNHIENIGPIFLDKEIEDNQLRMIFTCCHPGLSTSSQLALTLKTLCGFGVSEIAKALLTNKATINKRLFRAKQKIRSLEISFEVPSGEALDQRLDNVCIALYLLFNEGYNSSNQDAVICKDLCIEAMRLTKLLVDRFQKESKLKALLALMCLHSARFEARIDNNGTIIIFEDQNRALWNQDLIAKGIQLLSQAAVGDVLSVYHLEAGIAAEHCLSTDFSATNWLSIYQQYDKLYAINNNPLVLLNMAIVKSQTEGIAASLKALEKISTDKKLVNYYLLPMTKGVFYLKINDRQKARACLKQALSLTNSKQEMVFIEAKLNQCTT